MIDGPFNGHRVPLVGLEEITHHAGIAEQSSEDDGEHVLVNGVHNHRHQNLHGKREGLADIVKRELKSRFSFHIKETSNNKYRRVHHLLPGQAPIGHIEEHHDDGRST